MLGGPRIADRGARRSGRGLRLTALGKLGQPAEHLVRAGKLLERGGVQAERLLGLDERMVAARVRLSVLAGDHVLARLALVERALIERW